MRIRSVKPAFFKNYELADLGPYAMLLFEGLWCASDAFGKLEDRPRLLKVEILPYFDVDVDDLLNQLADAGFIVRYEVEGVRYILVPTFRNHQRITGKEAETQSKFPDPPSKDVGKQPGNNGETTETTGREGKGGERTSPSGEERANAPDAKKKPKSPPGMLADALPEEYRTDELRSAWSEFEAHRKDKGVGLYTTTGCKSLATLLISNGYKPHEVPALIRHCMAGNWQGIPPEVVPKFKANLARGPTKAPMGTQEKLLANSKIYQQLQESG